MSNPVIFRELPATFPQKDRFQKPSLLGSIVFHGFLVGVLLLMPLMFTQAGDQLRLLTYVTAPLPPPPPPPPSEAAAAPRPQAPKTIREMAPGALIAPQVVPKDIQMMADTLVATGNPIIAGVPGGMPGGAIGGVIGGILSPDARTAMEAPLPPPPPPVVAALAPKGPVRVGGEVREPKIIKLVPPIYPQLAALAHVSGTVVLDTTLTAQGTVDQIHVISGNPLLVNAAIDCVKQWKYQPTFLNGRPVAVVLTATVSFVPTT